MYKCINVDLCINVLQYSCSPVDIHPHVMAPHAEAGGAVSTGGALAARHGAVAHLETGGVTDHTMIN